VVRVEGIDSPVTVDKLDDLKRAIVPPIATREWVYLPWGKLPDEGTLVELRLWEKFRVHSATEDNGMRFGAFTGVLFECLPEEIYPPSAVVCWRVAEAPPPMPKTQAREGWKP
jgi:hypothetical protein